MAGVNEIFNLVEGIDEAPVLGSVLEPGEITPPNKVDLFVNQLQTHSLPPGVITDAVHNRSYTRGRFLGRGGYARCYEVTDNATQDVFACKIVSKHILRRATDRAKMAQEIKLHRALAHEFIVQFSSYFEDVDNVYILMELCQNKSLMELSKRRIRLTEGEARYYLRQIMIALEYLNGLGIIHRDLKLSNIFINHEMKLKIGDFGLATKCVKDNKRLTMCGTPNYMSPEVLNKKGHSLEVDMWSCGCIFYTLLYGRPPFETESVKETYGLIKRASYYLPIGERVSEDARALITQMLQLDPALRPTPSQVLQSDFLTKVKFPYKLPSSVLTVAPRPLTVRRQLEPIHQNRGLVVPSNAEMKVTERHMRNLSDQLRELLTAVMSKAFLKEFNDDAEDPTSAPLLWVTKWVDYSDKYGLGYQLADGSIGVKFNDDSKLILFHSGNHVQYVEKDGLERFFILSKVPTDLQKKLKLLNYFNHYMNENLITAGGEGLARPVNLMARLPSIWTWFRSNRSVVFVQTNGTLQINDFHTHEKVILCPLLSAITSVQGDGPLKTYTFASLGANGCTKELAERIEYAFEKLKCLLETIPEGGKPVMKN